MATLPKIKKPVPDDYRETGVLDDARTEPQTFKLLRAVHGRMVDPHTGREFLLVPCEAGEVTPWMQSQIDAGKLEWL